MSDAETPSPDWLGPALDRLEDSGLMEARACLEALFEVAGELESDVRRTQSHPAPTIVRLDPASPVVKLIAAARGETPEATIRRLGPRPWGAESSNEMWTNRDRITLADILAFHALPRSYDAYASAPYSGHIPPEPDPEPDPVARSARNPGLAGYLRPKVDRKRPRRSSR